MTPGSLFRDLNNFLSLLLNSQIALTTTTVIDVLGHMGNRSITWSNNYSVPGDLFRFDSSTVSEYQRWIESRGYSAILFDGSFVQISYNFRRSELVGHRLLYFPCPFDMDMELLDEISLPDLIELYSEEGTGGVKLRTPVRFDYDPSSWKTSHPASHMTFQWANARIAVSSPLSLGHFIQFVFQNFYPTYWYAHEFLNQWPCDELETTISTEERGVLHLSSISRSVINLINAS